jgi:ferric-dicitrate binding protein FerR (iron transport regulator)
MRGTAKRERLLRQAASWFERIHDADVSQRQVRSWERWMTRSAANRQAFRAVADVCRIMDRLRDSRLRPH